MAPAKKGAAKKAITKKPVKKVAKKVAKKAVAKKTVAKKVAATKVVKAKRDPNQPKKAKSAFFMFLGENRDAIMKAANAGPTDLALIGKQAGRSWAALTPAAKKKYEDAAAKDKVRYEKEKKAFLAKGGVFVSKKKRVKKDKNAPKRAMSAFFFFANANRDDIRKRIGAEPKEIAKIGTAIGKAWGELNDAAKAKYVAQSQKDAVRYQREKAAYEKKMK